MVKSVRKGDLPAAYLIPLSALEFELVCDLLSCGCHLFFQKGKQRLPVDKEQRVLLGDLVEDCAVRAPHPRGSIGLDVGSLPSGISLIDVDDPFAAHAIKAYLGEERPLIIESTPSGGLHIWGRGLDLGGSAKNGLCAAGIPVEYFLGGRITILGENRSVYQRTPLAEVGTFPPPLWPARGGHVVEARVPIPKGTRWNTLYERVMTNQSTQRETLLFQARYLCDPPLEEDKERDLLRILEKRAEAQADEEAEGQAGEGTAGPDLELDAHVGALLADQFKETWAYLLPDEQWYEYRDLRWDSPPGWSYDMLNKIKEEMKKRGAAFTRSQQRRMSSQHFLKSVEERLRRHLMRVRTADRGLPFLNGVLVPGELGPELIPPSPSWVCTSYASIPLDLCTRITPVQKSFLLTLMDGDVLKLNLLRAFLRLIFTLDTREQFSLFLWGPGATGKSTLTELLEHILGGRCETLDVSRIANRFELTLLEGKNLLLFPDVTRQPSNAAASILKRLLSNERVTVEAKGRPAMSVKPGAHSLFTANWRWPDVDRSIGGRRRFLFIHTPRTVMRRNPFLIERLKEDASGIVTWALGMPPEKTRIGHSVEALNELTGGGADCSGLIEWVTKKVRYCPGSKIPLGAKKVPLPGSLYEDYTLYANANGIEPFPFNKFGEALDDVIRSQGYRDVLIKRRALGRIVQGLSLSEGEPIRKNKVTGSMRYLMETSPWPGFGKDKDEWERGGCETIDCANDMESADDVNSVNSVNSFDSVDTFNPLNSFNRLTGLPLNQGTTPCAPPGSQPPGGVGCSV